MPLVLSYIAPSRPEMATDRMIISIESTTEVQAQKNYLVKMGCYTMECSTHSTSTMITWYSFQHMLCEFGKQGVRLRMASCAVIYSGPLGGICASHRTALGFACLKVLVPKARRISPRGSSKISIDFKQCLLTGHFKLLGQGDQRIKRNNILGGGKLTLIIRRKKAAVTQCRWGDTCGT